MLGQIVPQARERLPWNHVRHRRWHPQHGPPAGPHGALCKCTKMPVPQVDGVEIAKRVRIERPCGPKGHFSDRSVCVFPSVSLLPCRLDPGLLQIAVHKVREVRDRFPVFEADLGVDHVP